MYKYKQTSKKRNSKRAFALGMTGIMALPTVVAIAPNYASAEEVTETEIKKEAPFKVTNFRTSALATGNKSMMAITADGGVAGWGYNAGGKFGLGYGGNTYFLEPVFSTNLEGLISISSTESSTVGLKDDGTVWVSGASSSAMLPMDSPSFVQVSGLSNIVKVTTNPSTAYVLDSNGDAYYFGGGGSSTPKKLVHDVKFKDIAIGGNGHIFAVTEEGKFGKITLGSAYEDSNNVKYQLIDFKEITISGTVKNIFMSQYGDNVGLVLEDGTVQLYDKAKSTSRVIEGLTDVVSLAVSGEYTLALKDNGDVYAWGTNYGGALGIGTAVGSEANPVKISKLSNIVAIATGSYGSMTSIALDKNGIAYTWGPTGQYKTLGRTGTESLPYPINGKYTTSSGIVPLSEQNYPPVLTDKTTNKATLVGEELNLEVKGLVKDSVGSAVTIKYKIDGVEDSLTTITSDGKEQDYFKPINIPKTVGEHTVEIWAEDKDGAKSEVKTITLDVTKEMLGLENRPELLDTTEDAVQIDGENLVLTMSGMIKDKDVGDKVTVKYSINGQEESLNRVITANGKNQVYMETITLPELPAPVEVATFGLRTLVLLDEAGSKQDIEVWAEDDKGYQSEKSIITVTIPATGKEETGKEETGTGTEEGVGNDKDNSGEGADTGEGKDEGNDKDNTGGETDNGSNSGGNTGGESGDGEDSSGGNTDGGSTDTGSGGTGNAGSTETGPDSGSGVEGDKPSSGTGGSGNGNNDSGSVATPPISESGTNSGVTPPSNGTGSSTGGNTSGGSTGSNGESTVKPTNPVIPSSPTLSGEQAKELGYVLLADKTTENDVMVAFSRQALSDTGKVKMIVNVAPKEDIVEPILYMYYVKTGEESKPFSVNDLDLLDKVSLDTVKAGETLTLDVPTKLKIGKDYSVAAVVVDKNGKVFSKNELDSKTLKKYMVLSSVNSNLESKGMFSKLTTKVASLFSSK